MNLKHFLFIKEEKREELKNELEQVFSGNKLYELEKKYGSLIEFAPDGDSFVFLNNLLIKFYPDISIGLDSIDIQFSKPKNLLYHIKGNGGVIGYLNELSDSLELLADYLNKKYNWVRVNTILCDDEIKKLILQLKISGEIERRGYETYLKESVSLVVDPDLVLVIYDRPGKPRITSDALGRVRVLEIPVNSRKSTDANINYVFEEMSLLSLLENHKLRELFSTTDNDISKMFFSYESKADINKYLRKILKVDNDNDGVCFVDAFLKANPDVNFRKLRNNNVEVILKVNNIDNELRKTVIKAEEGVYYLKKGGKEVGFKKYSEVYLL